MRAQHAVHFMRRMAPQQCLPTRPLPTLQRRCAQTLLSISRVQFRQLMAEEVGTDIAVLKSTTEYQQAEVAAVWLGAKAEVTRQTGKTGLNVGTQVASSVTRGFHDATFGKVAETETYKKIDKTVITPVMKADQKQLFHFRGMMSPEMLTLQKDLRTKFVDKHRTELSANTTETSLVLSSPKSKVTTWYKAAMDKLGIVSRRRCIDRIMYQYPAFTENKFLFDYQTYLIPSFMRAVWDEDLENLQKMCTKSCFKLRVHPYLVQLKGYKSEASLLQVDTPMLVQAEMLSPDELMVEDAEEEAEDDEDDFDDAKAKKKKKSNKKKKEAEQMGETPSDDKEEKEDLFQEEDFVSSEVRKLPALTLAASTQVYEVYRDAQGKVVHGNAEIAATMGHMWRMCMLPTGEWVIADVQFGSRYGMES
jgi:hypothetical protein